MKKLLPLLLCLALAVLLAHGMPPISREFNTHCRCAEVESRMIPPDRLKSLKIFPRDAHCHKTEVILGWLCRALNTRDNVCDSLVHISGKSST
ncbi:uncharacterized protein LOC132475695 isoform X2 [Gadus macrocephalus]|uniref:uncharacterized protein LOC132475695 isoform X2 n=1 Tax=Gadus macrocephalus TaxID=80720 RepID=UPI0028CB5D7B|nr:uncharacterized protein LOC132475695 isoform X2 [Gadus macrocephalus]